MTFFCWRGIDEEASTALLFAAQVSLSGRLGNVLIKKG